MDDKDLKRIQAAVVKELNESARELKALMSDTPRTDEAEKASDMKDRVPAWFARQLERELAEAMDILGDALEEMKRR